MTEPPVIPLPSTFNPAPLKDWTIQALRNARDACSCRLREAVQHGAFDLVAAIGREIDVIDRELIIRRLADGM